MRSKKSLNIDELSKLDYTYPYTNFDIPSCVYFLYFNDELCYIGSTSMLPLRICQHLKHKEKKFNKVFYIPIQKQFLRETEEKLIKYYVPDLNNETFLRKKDFITSNFSVYDLKDKIISQQEEPVVNKQIYFKEDFRKSERDRVNEKITRVMQEVYTKYNREQKILSEVWKDIEEGRV